MHTAQISGALAGSSTHATIWPSAAVQGKPSLSVSDEETPTDTNGKMRISLKGQKNLVEWGYFGCLRSEKK